MRLALVSTFPPTRCGIAVYSQNLVSALQDVDPDLEINILAEGPNIGSTNRVSERILVSTVFNRGADYGRQVLDAVQKCDADVVHFQHASDVLGEDERLPALLKELRADGRRIVVTLHTVHGSRDYMRLFGLKSSADFQRSLGIHSHRLILHHRHGMARRLEEQGLAPFKLEVIPHGTRMMDLPAQDVARRRLGLRANGPVFLFFGFIHVQKNVHTVLEAFILASRTLKDATLVIAGAPFGDFWYNKLYTNIMRKTSEVVGLGNRVVIRDGFVPAEEVPDLFSASDVLLLPHWQAYGSASGVFHQAIGSGRPVILARGPKFEDAMDLFRNAPEVCVGPANVFGWAQAMVQLATDEALRRKVKDSVIGYAKATEWHEVARRHLGVYQKSLQP